MNKINRALFSLALLAAGWTMAAQTGAIVLRVSSEVAQPGEQVCLQVTGSGFADIIAMQFSVNWDPEVLEYVETKDYALPALAADNFGTFSTASGNLTLAYLAPIGQMLPEDIELFTICFKAVGAAGTASAVEISGSPTGIEFVGEIGDDAVEVTNHSLLGGSVLIPAAGASPDPLRLDIGDDMLTTCLTGGQAVLAAEAAGGTPPYRYDWTGPSGYRASGASITVLSTGGYRLTATDAGGNAVRATFTVVKSTLQVTEATVTDASCGGKADGAAAVTAGGGEAPRRFRWSNGASSSSIAGLEPGQYTVTVSDATGCAVARMVEVGAGPGVTLAPTVQAPTCGEANGSVALNAASANGGLTARWSNAAEAFTLSSLAPGTYTVTVTDGAGCTARDTFAFAWTPLEGAVAVDCQIADDGPASYSASANAEGGAAPYTFRWSTGAEAVSVENHNAEIPAPGDYSLTITDSDDCQTTVAFTVEECDPGRPDPVWPGDTDRDGEVSHFDLLNIGLGFGLEGPARTGASTDWRGQTAVAWNDSTPVSGVDYAYADTDGNGRIGAADTLAIVRHWGRTTPSEGLWPRVTPRSPTTAGLLVEPAEARPGEAAAFAIRLDGVPEGGVYGLAFTIVYDSLAVVPEGVRADFAGSWLGTPGADLLVVQRNDPANHRLHVALTRTDHENRSGEGALGTLRLLLIDAVPGGEMTYEMNFRPENARLIDAAENPVEVEAQPTTAILQASTSVNDPILARQVRLFPNPVRGLLRLDTGELHPTRIDLLLPGGQHLQSWPPADHIDLSGRPAGMYWVRIVTREGVVVKGVVVNE